MLHKKISVSSQVDKLSLPARLLFTWMIAHADDEGRLKGDAKHIKAMVVPMTKWSFKKIETYLHEIKNVRLIYYWEQNNEWYIEFIEWDEHQTIQKDRFKKSLLPSFIDKHGYKVDTSSIQNVSQSSSQSNLSEDNEDKVKKSEEKESEPIANKSFKVVNPKTFTPSNEGENIALETHKRLEPNNPFAFQVTYLKALERGLPLNLFGEFASQIEQDQTIRNRGAVFNEKVRQYFEERVRK